MPALLAAALVVFLEGLSFGVILPVLQPLTAQYGGTEVWAGILFAAATLPRIFLAPAWGRLSDHIGRRPTIALVALGTSAASVLWALSLPLGGVVLSSLLWLLASRIVYGLFAAQSVLAMAVASDVSTPARRAAAMGAVGAAFGLAFSIGPALGGLFVTHVGPSVEDGRALLGYLMAGLQFASVLVALFLLRETRPASAPLDGPDEMFVKPTKMIHLATLPAVATLMAVTIASTAAYSVLFPTLPSLARSRHGWTELHTGYALSAFGVLGAFVQGGLIRPLVKRRGEKFVAMLGLALLVAGLAWIAEEFVEWQFWGALALMAVGTGLCVPAVTGMMSISVHERDQGAVHGLNQSATSIGRTVGFAASGLLFVRFGPTDAYLTAAAVAALALLLAWRAPSRAR